LLSQPRPFPITTGLLLGAVVSSLTWLPLHAIERSGVAGPWVVLTVIVIAFLPFLRALLKLRGLARRDLTDLARIAALIGVDYAFYTASLTTTQVSRTLPLFYMAPVWGTLLEVFALRQPLTLRRAARVTDP